MLHNLKRTFYFLRGHIRKYVAGIIGMTLLQTGAALLESYLLRKILNAGKEQDVYTIWIMLCVFIGFIVIILCLLPVFHFWFNGQAKYGFGNVNKKLYHKLCNLPVGYFERNHSGSILAYFIGDTWGVAGIFMRHFKRVLSAVIMIVVYLIPMLVFDYRVGSLVFFINIISMFVNVKFSAKLKRQRSNIQKQNEQTIKDMSNIVENMSVIRVYGLQEKMLSQFKKNYAEIFGMEKERAAADSGLASYNYGIRMLCMGIYLLAGMVLVQEELSTYGNIFAIWSLQKSMSASFRELGDFFPKLVENLASTERVYSFLDIKEETL